MARGKPRDRAQDAEVIRILALVYDLSGQAVTLSATQVAAWTRRAQSSAQRRLVDLSRMGLVEYDGVRGYRPTEAGRQFLERFATLLPTEEQH